jgi:hypothetical protein
VAAAPAEQLELALTKLVAVGEEPLLLVLSALQVTQVRVQVEASLLAHTMVLVVRLLLILIT